MYYMYIKLHVDILKYKVCVFIKCLYVVSSM